MYIYSPPRGPRSPNLTPDTKDAVNNSITATKSSITVYAQLYYIHLIVFYLIQGKLS